MQEQRDQLSRDLDQRVKTIEKQHEDQIRELKHVHSKEKQELVEKLRIEISQVGWCGCTYTDLLIDAECYTGDGRGTGVTV